MRHSIFLFHYIAEGTDVFVVVVVLVGGVVIVVVVVVVVLVVVLHRDLFMHRALRTAR
jgi:hypothetical protein